MARARQGSDPAAVVQAKSGPHIVLRNEPFEYGLLPLAQSKLELEAIQKLLVYAHSKGERGYPSLSFGVWRKWATDVAGMTSEIAWLHFECFDLIHDVGDDRRLKLSVNEAALATDAERERFRSRLSVNTLEFALFLYLQQSRHTSLRARLSDPEGEWPSRPSSADDDAQPAASSYAEKRYSNEVHRVNFVMRGLGDILRLLTEPAMYNAAEAELVVPAASLTALDLYMVCLPQRGQQPQPVAAVATRQTEVPHTGYSKITQTFGLSQLQRWLQDHIVAHPGVAKAASMPEPKPFLARNARHSILSRLQRKTLQLGAEGISGSELSIFRCSSSFIYVLAPLKHVSIEDTRKCVIVLGAVSGNVRLHNCRRVTVICACRRFVASQVDDCTVHLCCTTGPVLGPATRDLLLVQALESFKKFLPTPTTESPFFLLPGALQHVLCAAGRTHERCAPPAHHQQMGCPRPLHCKRPAVGLLLADAGQRLSLFFNSVCDGRRHHAQPLPHARRLCSSPTRSLDVVQAPERAVARRRYG
eukprot:m.312093 g.312093  ORF g.312093 m.312093 type:complete len:531 (-) comp23048_c0_seq6:2256-3848(-)